MILSAVALLGYSQQPKYEMRAVWTATVSKIDWPTASVSSPDNAAQIAKQQKQLTDYLDHLQACNLNSVCLQVRSLSDALYKSRFEPWSSSLTGRRGADPGYDPLQFAIDEAHKRGMELHVWVNPFRYETSAGSYVSNTQAALANDAADRAAGRIVADTLRNAHPDWLLAYSNGSFNGTIIDPGLPEARRYVVEVLMEIVGNYDIEGIIMDDYFYPYGGTTDEDRVSKSKYKPSGMTDEEWRLSNVNTVMQALYDSIQHVKPWVRFGMGPFGIWTTRSDVADMYGLTLPAGIVGLDDYSVQYCDPMAWTRGGYVDYLAPQLYWPTDSKGQDYDVLCEWWAQSVKHFSDQLPDGKRVYFHVSQACYRGFSQQEMEAEVDDNRAFCPYDAPGSIFYNTNTFVDNYADGLAGTHFFTKALLPPMRWKSHKELSAPQSLVLEGTTLSWSHPEAVRFTVYAYPKGRSAKSATSKAQYLVGIVYGNTIDLKDVANLADKTLAVCAYDLYGNEFEPALWNESENADVAVTGVRLLQDSVVIARTKELTLEYELLPDNAGNKDVYWRSTNPGVAKVKDGVVTGMSDGTALIIVTTDDGDYADTCSVRVREGVLGVVLRVRSLSLNVGQTKHLTAFVSPTDAEDKSVEWASADEQVATVDTEGNVTGVGAGETDVTVTTVDGGFTASCHVTVNGQQSSGLDEQHFSLVIAATQQGLMVKTSAEADICVYTVSGMQVASARQQTLWTTPLSHGVYLIRVNNKTYKFVKQ